MAVFNKIGTATNHRHLLEIIRDFLKNDPGLVAAGQNWAQLNGPTGELTAGDSWSNNHITLRGPGLSGDDEIYVSLYFVEDDLAENWRLTAYCHGGYVPGSTIDTHPVTSPITRVPVWNQPMPYWIVADGRSFGVVAQVSTVFVSGTWGFGIPNVLKKNYPKPFLAHGCGGTTGSWTSQSTQHRFIADPGWSTTFALWPDNVWRTVANWSTNQSGQRTTGEGFVFPTINPYSQDYFSFGSYDAANAAWMPTVKGNYVPRRLRVKCGNPYTSNLFYVDKFFVVSGRQGISAGNIMTIEGSDFLVVQNVFRTGFNDYMLMRLT